MSVLASTRRSRVQATQCREDLPFLARIAEGGACVALRDGRRTITYAGLRDRIDDLIPRLGGGGRRLVVLAAANTVDLIVAYLAVLRAGHVALLAPPCHAAALAEEFAADTMVDSGGIHVRTVRRTLPLHPDLALLLSTSGSTGSPKLVRLSYPNLASNATGIVASLDLRRSDRAATTLSPAYSYGLSVLHSLLSVGGCLMLTDRSVTEPRFWCDARRARVTTLAGVPHTFELLDRIGFEAAEMLPSLRLLTCAGGRLPATTARRYAEAGERDGYGLALMYGATEATARMACLPPALAVAHPGAAGMALPGGELRIDNPDAEGVGRVVYRGPNVMMGYARGAADLASGPELAELVTGDRGRICGAGLLEVVGRDAPFAKVFGLRVDLDRVERRIEESGVSAIAVDHDGVLGVLVQACPNDSLARDRMLALLREVTGLPPAGLRVRLVADLPRGASGKPDRAAAAAQLDLADGGWRVGVGAGTGACVAGACVAGACVAGACVAGNCVAGTCVAGAVPSAAAAGAVPSAAAAGAVPSAAAAARADGAAVHGATGSGASSGTAAGTGLEPAVAGRGAPVPTPLHALEVAFTEVLGRPAAATDSFVSLRGDSLSYVAASLEVERVVGCLPAQWHRRTLAELADLAGVPRAESVGRKTVGVPRRSRSGTLLHASSGGWVQLDVAVVVRALAILAVVGSHAGVMDVRGGAHVLVALVGVALARFGLPVADLAVRLRTILASAARILLPSLAWIGLVAAVADSYSWSALGGAWLTSPTADTPDWRYWFVGALLWLLPALALILRVPALEAARRRRPFGVPVAATLAAWGAAQVLVPEARPAVLFAPLAVLWMLLLGWVVAEAHDGVRRAAATGLVAVLVPATFTESRAIVVPLGLAALIWLRRVRLPGAVARAVAAVAAASLALYLTHWQVLDLVHGWPAVIVSVGVAVLAERVSRRLTALWRNARSRWVAAAGRWWQLAHAA